MSQENYRKANAIEKAFNNAYGFFVGLGIGASYSYLLEVRGRKSGKIYSTPVYQLLQLAQLSNNIRYYR